MISRIIMKIFKRNKEDFSKKDEDTGKMKLKDSTRYVPIKAL